MKKLIPFLFSLLLLGCAEATLDETEVRVVSGRWELINVNGGIEEINVDFEPGEIVLNLNVFNNTLSLSCFLEDSDSKKEHLPFEQGVYVFELLEQNGEFLYTYDFFLEGENLGVLAIRAGKLELDFGPVAEGSLFTFER